MKKIFLVLVPVFFVFSMYAQSDDDIPIMNLPEVSIDIEDRREVFFDIFDDETNLLDLEIDRIEQPDFTDEIRVDLEKTLPQQIVDKDSGGSVDALIKFGYGLNNYLLADFSIFIKEINPKIAINYLREAKEQYWVDFPDERNPYSKDELTSELYFQYNLLSLNANLMYFNESIYLQEESVYDDLTKRLLTIDLSPSIKFKYQNDLTLFVNNSFFFTDAISSGSDIFNKRFNFDYFLDFDLIYSQVFLINHNFSVHGGYEFYSYRQTAQGVLENTDPYFGHLIKTGATYSGLFKDSFLLRANLDFYGYIQEEKFNWYLIPNLRAGYNYLEFFQCYIEGGAKYLGKQNRQWFTDEQYAVMSKDLLPGYRWYAKTGVKSMVSNWFEAETDLTFNFDWDGFDWRLTSDEERLYTYEKREKYELNINTEMKFNYKQYFETSVSYKHYFLDRSRFNASSQSGIKIKAGIPNVGLSFTTDFEMHFYRKDIDDNTMPPLFLLNAGLDWSYKELFGFGIVAENLIYIDRYQRKTGYDEPGVELLIYLKIGFGS